MRCRHCRASSTKLIADLGVQPPANAYLRQADLFKEETFFPLQLYVCEKCFLVQIRDYTVKETFFHPRLCLLFVHLKNLAGSLSTICHGNDHKAGFARG